jgi:hypothetical protein
MHAASETQATTLVITSTKTRRGSKGPMFRKKLQLTVLAYLIARSRSNATGEKPLLAAETRP